jgi:hypothetical protein
MSKNLITGDFQKKITSDAAIIQGIEPRAVYFTLLYIICIMCVDCMTAFPSII